MTEDSLVNGRKSWTVKLHSVEGEPELMYAEGYLLKSYSGIIAIDVIPTCPIASKTNSLFLAQTQAGRKGQDFAVMLEGQEKVHGTVNHVTGGTYKASFTTPKVGKYSMSVMSTKQGGLIGEYFNNRWMFGNPSLTRVDKTIDFLWSSTDSITQTGKDYVSVRWIGYIKPLFEEVYTFKIQANDGLKFWIDDELLVDKYEMIVSNDDKFVEHTAKTSSKLIQGRLTDLKLEFRENQGNAMIRLLWESKSQGLSIIDSNYLFSSSFHIKDSPFTVVPTSIKPTAPQDCSIEVVDWDKLKVEWRSPTDSGGEDVTSYLIEYWDDSKESSKITEIQQIRLSKTISNGSFLFKMGNERFLTPVTLEISARNFENAMEYLSSIGDISVTKKINDFSIDFFIEYLTNNAPVPVISIDMEVSTLQNHEYCVCQGGGNSCFEGSFHIGCLNNTTRKGSISTAKKTIVIDTLTQKNASSMSYILPNLVQPANSNAGFGTRVSAGNANGYGIPCENMVLKPMGLPDAPSSISLVRDRSCSTSLILHFTMVSYPADKASVVSSFLVEWSTTEEFTSNVFSDVVEPASNLSARLSTYSAHGEPFFKYKILNLSPGVNYYVRIGSINSVGVGPFSLSIPSVLAPGKKPNKTTENINVRISTILADASVSVHESSSSLKVTWKSLFHGNGFPILDYMIEYWKQKGQSEIAKLTLVSANGPPRGTFTLSYDGVLTDSLPCNVSAEELQTAVEAFPSIRLTRVERSGLDQNRTWTISFLSEAPFISGKRIEIARNDMMTNGLSEKPIISLTIDRQGTIASAYNKISLPGNTLNDDFNSYTLTGLQAGQNYFVQISARNMLGYSRPCPSVPKKLSPPRQKPSAPTNLSLMINTGQSLQVIFSEPFSDGGDRVTKYEIEWDVAATFDSKNGSPLGTGIINSPDVIARCSPCRYLISNLVKGTGYYVRVYSFNSFGNSIDPAYPYPPSLAPKSPPYPPSNVFVIPISDTSVDVKFHPPSDDGGQNITKYKIEWNEMRILQDEDISSVTSREMHYYPYSVQAIMSSSDKYDIEGHFFLSFEGHISQKIPGRCSAYEMKIALEELPTIGSVSISMHERNNGQIWLITFLTNFGDDAWFGNIPLIAVSVSGDDSKALFTQDTFGTNGTLTGTNVRLVVKSHVQAFKGFEQQSIETFCSTDIGILTGSFQLSFNGQATRLLEHNISASSLEKALEDLNNVLDVIVTRKHMSQTKRTFQWNIIFVEHLGNVPLLSAHDHLICSNGKPDSHIIVKERITGSFPNMEHSDFIEIIPHARDRFLNQRVDNLHLESAYHFKVSAWNGVGNSYGPSMHCKPAIVFPIGVPDSPSNILVTPVDNSRLEVSWTAPLESRSAIISKYRIEWNDDIGQKEIQSIAIMSSSKITGFMFITFKGLRSGPIQISASASEIKNSIEALQNIQKIEVATFVEGFNMKWNITFTSNVADQPLMEIDTSSLRGEHILSEIFEVQKGSSSILDKDELSNKGTMEIGGYPEVQCIAVTTAANDLGGFFVAHFMGQVSTKIRYDDDEWDVKEALESMSTVFDIEVDIKELIQSSTIPPSSFGRKWCVTFISQKGNLPSLLVDTGTSAPSLVSASGTLTGSSPIVKVVTIIDGGMPSSFIIPQLKEGNPYVFRLQAFNGFVWSFPSFSSFYVSPEKQVPSEPIDVRAHVISGSQIGVSWNPPTFDGGAPILSYSVQWKCVNCLEYKSTSVTAEHLEACNRYIISDLKLNDSYSVRVMARNSVGYGIIGSAELIDKFIIHILQFNATNTSTYLNHKFSINIKTKDSEKNTGLLSFLSSSNQMADALNSLLNHGIVSVSREDHSTIYDSTNIDTTQFHMIYRITFVNRPKKDEVHMFSIGGNNSSISSSFVQHEKDFENENIIKVSYKRPSGPSNVMLFVVSRTELGVTWSEPLYNGGLSIRKYLVEWSESNQMEKSKVTEQKLYLNSIESPLDYSEVTTQNKLQIRGLEFGKRYYVRVSAYNAMGYSDAVSSSPEFAVPMEMKLYSPNSVSLRVSQLEIADRLDLHWSLPHNDSNGFITYPDECGITLGHTPNIASGYEVRFDTNPSMRNSTSYTIPMVKGDGQQMICCPHEECSIQLGAEVQTITLNSRSSSRISDGSFKIVYVGEQNLVALIIPSSGSQYVSLISSSIYHPISEGDFVRITEGVYKIIDVTENILTLSSPYTHGGSGTQIIAYYNSPPSTCIDYAVDSSAEAIRAHIANNFNDSPFSEEVKVSRRNFASPTGQGSSYHITFIGEAFSRDVVQELFIVSNLEPWFDNDCKDPFKVGGLETAQVTIDVKTDFNSGSLAPGTSYFVEIAAINDAGIGMFAHSSPRYQKPRSRPGLAQNCKVRAVASSSNSLQVDWEGVDFNNGDGPSTYKVNFISDKNTTVSHLVEDIDERSLYSIVETRLIPGDLYEVFILATNDQGEGCPMWYTNVNTLDGSLSSRKYIDLQNRSCRALPTCDSSSIKCIESNEYIIKARSVPPNPLITAATHPNISNRNRFSSNSIFVTFDSNMNLKTTGDDVDFFKIEWSKDPLFLHSYSHVTTNPEYLIPNLEIGEIYYVRVKSHNTAGYGRASLVAPVKPMQKPDPPKDPILSSLSGSEYGIEEIGTCLYLTWETPTIDDKRERPDLVGNGGDEITNYLIEWSDKEWDQYVSSVWEISIPGNHELTGMFRVSLDTTEVTHAPIRGFFKSADIPVDSSIGDITIILQNMPNIGEVEVSSPLPKIWRITFNGEVGNVSSFNLHNSSVSIKGSTTQIPLYISQIRPGSSPIGAAYNFHIFDVKANQSLEYVIGSIVPGRPCYVRISARNQIGFGSRRNTAPPFLAPPVQKPGQPVSPFNKESNPNLSVQSSTSLLVQIGAPNYDGGSPLTCFLVEWDYSSSFNSSPDGLALHSERIEAKETLCEKCATSFDIGSNTLAYSGNSDTMKVLSNTQRIMVFFSDDNKFYLFYVLSATASEILVSSQHLRQVSLVSMKAMSDNGEGSDLITLGAEFTIGGLVNGVRYFVRVAAENSEMGSGLPVPTMPSSEMLRGAPSSPSGATLSVIDKNSLQVDWDFIAQDSSNSLVTIESFTKSDVLSASNSFFGTQEIVVLDTVGAGVTGGFFALSFGHPTRKLPGTVTISKGAKAASSSFDLTPLLTKGDTILIANETFTLNDTQQFTSAKIPLSMDFKGSSVEHVAAFTHYKTMYLPINVSDSILQEALENLPPIGKVKVRRSLETNHGFKWTITFLTNMGPQPEFKIDQSRLLGGESINLKQEKIVGGILPDNFQSYTVYNHSMTSLRLPNLNTGQVYYVQLHVLNDRGKSSKVVTSPEYAIPGDVPDPPNAPRILPWSLNSILVKYEETAKNNGAHIDNYIIEIDTTPSFSNASSTIVQMNNRFQKVVVDAHSIPWDPSSTFTLSLGDFHGDFSRSVGTETFISMDSENFLAKRVVGTTSLFESVTRGDFLKIAGEEVRVCLNESNGLPYDEQNLPICSLDGWGKPVIDNSDFLDAKLVPIFLLDTSLGSAKHPRLGDSFLYTVNNGGSHNDITQKINRGDFVRVGHPKHGETFRISTNESLSFDYNHLPLATVDDPYKSSSITFKALQHSSYEVQSLIIRATETVVALTPSNITKSGFRLRIGQYTTDRTTSGGSNGCLQWDGEPSLMKTEIEFILGKDSIEVNKEIIPYSAGISGAGVTYHITFSGKSVRGKNNPIMIIDIGENGCLDADDYGNTFSSGIALATVYNKNIAFLPFYKVQTTASIPFNATAKDVKFALENLSQVCKADVSRDIYRNGFAWRITFAPINTGFEEFYSPLIAMTSNGENLNSLIDPEVRVISFQEIEIKVNLPGVRHFARLSAKNKFGSGRASMSNPISIQPADQIPTKPRHVFTEALSNSEIFVQWEMPLYNGGTPITHYKIEYDEKISFDSGPNNAPYGMQIVSSNKMGSIADIQTVTVSVDPNPLSYIYIGGTFMLSFDGQTTKQLPHDATPQDMKMALEELCTISNVSVTRSMLCSIESNENSCSDVQGYTWIISFFSVTYAGDQYNRCASPLRRKRTNKFEVDGSFLYACKDRELTVCNKFGYSKATLGTTQEIQRFSVAKSDFTISALGQTTQVIAKAETVENLKKKIEALSSIGTVDVSCIGCHDKVIASGRDVYLTFMSLRGDIPDIVISDPNVTVVEVMKGICPYKVGRSSFSSIIYGLTSVKTWHVRVSAFNKVGSGNFVNSQPSPNYLYVVAPSAPSNMVASSSSSSSVKISWNSPVTNGGTPISDFIIEYDASQTFTSKNGKVLHSLKVNLADVDNSIGLVSGVYPNHPNNSMRKKIFIADQSLLNNEVITPGSKITISKQKFVVMSITI